MTDLFPGETGNRAHYRGDVVNSVMTQLEPFGPDNCGPRGMGAKYTPVSATYDPGPDRTTVQFRPIPKSDRPRGMPLPEELPPLTRQQRRQFTREIRKSRARKENARR